MKAVAPIALMLVLVVVPGAAPPGESQTGKEKLVAAEMKRLAAYEMDLVLRNGDREAMARFCPDDRSWRTPSPG
jgi:hypothetical protein